MIISTAAKRKISQYSTSVHKNSQKTRIQEFSQKTKYNFNMIKAINEKLTANIILNGKRLLRLSP